MRKKLSVLTVLLVGMGVAGWFWAGRAANADDDGRSFGFGQRIAGAYYTTGEGGFGPFVALTTMNSDGTFTNYNTDGDPANGFGSTDHGTWKRVGPRKIAYTSLFLVFDADGALSSIFRSRGVTSYSHDFSETTGSFSLDIFLPGQDPLTDVPVATDSGTFEGRRIPVMN